MALIRFDIQLAIPEEVYAAIPAVTKTAFQDKIRALKALAVKINAGKTNEEMTVRAVWHKCYHDENINKPCESEREI